MLSPVSRVCVKCGIFGQGAGICRCSLCLGEYLRNTCHHQERMHRGASLFTSDRALPRALIWKMAGIFLSATRVNILKSFSLCNPATSGLSPLASCGDIAGVTSDLLKFDQCRETNRWKRKCIASSTYRLTPLICQRILLALFHASKVTDPF